jgi:hypothetical protein
MRYLVESYLPPPSPDALERLEARAIAAANGLAQAGGQLRYIEAIVVPEDEMCLFVYEAGSAELAREASARAGIRCERIVEASVSSGGASRAHEEGDPR